MVAILLHVMPVACYVSYFLLVIPVTCYANYMLNTSYTNYMLHANLYQLATCFRSVCDAFFRLSRNYCHAKRRSPLLLSRPSRATFRRRCCVTFQIIAILLRILFFLFMKFIRMHLDVDKLYRYSSLFYFFIFFFCEIY